MIGNENGTATKKTFKIAGFIKHHLNQIFKATRFSFVAVPFSLQNFYI